jgi:hypothetical protein
LYNLRPTWLTNAHAELDAAVINAYGWPPGLSDNEILESLLTLNTERYREEQLPRPLDSHLTRELTDADRTVATR